MTDILVRAVHVIHDNIAQNFELTGDINPETGAQSLRAISRVTNPGQFRHFPEQMARELIATGAAEEPDDRELKLYQISTGQLVEGAGQ